MICSKNGCGRKTHALSLCRKHYDQQRNRSKKRICGGCNRIILNKSTLCGSCNQRAMREILTRKLKIGSGGEILAIWDNKTKGFRIPQYQRNRLEAEKFREDLISQHYTKIIRRGYE